MFVFSLFFSLSILLLLRNSFPCILWILFLAFFLLLAGWSAFYVLFFSSTFSTTVFLRPRSFSFVFGLVDGCNFVVRLV